MDDPAVKPTATLVVDREEWNKSTLELEPDAFHHLFRVRRLQVGDAIRVVDGAGGARLARVERVGRSSARLALGDSLPSYEPELAVELLVAAPRPQRASWLVEKATEVGVSAIRFFQTARGPRSYGVSTTERLRRIARSAVEQSGRAVVPDVSAGHPWSELRKLIGTLDRCWFLDVEARRERLELQTSWRRVGFAIGPEGGWEPEEVGDLRGCGCIPVGLGERILRVETAALIAASSVLVTPSVDTL